MRNVLLIFLLGLIGCKDSGVFTPKPRMYPKINFPERSYKTFNESYCNMEFEVPAYAETNQEKTFFDEEPVHPCWFDLEIPSLNGRLHFSYYPIESQQRFDELVSDAFTFVEKHDIKANYRSETLINTPNDLHGIIFDIDGPVASPVQFFLTDSVSHFLRASLYFNNKVEPDSMAPIHAFVREDIDKMIQTMRFN